MSASTSPQAAYVREQMAEVALAVNFGLPPHRPVSECLATAYGPEGERGFWESVCSEPVRVKRFVKLLTITLDASECINPNRENEKAIRDLNLGASLIAAYQEDPANLAIFAGDLSSLEGAQHGKDLRAELKVNVREAAEWLLTKPKRRHLVPASLAGFIRDELAPAGIPAQPAVADKPHPRPSVAQVTRLFTKWVAGHESPNLPTRRQSDTWAAEQKIPVSMVRPLHKQLKRPIGRPKKLREN